MATRTTILLLLYYALDQMARIHLRPLRATVQSHSQAKLCNTYYMLNWSTTQEEEEEEEVEEVAAELSGPEHSG